MTQVSWSFTTRQRRLRRSDPAADRPGQSDGDRRSPPTAGCSSPRRAAASWCSTASTDATGTVVADLRVSVYNFWDRGMLGMALHPNFPTTPVHLRALHLRRRARRHRTALGIGAEPQVGDPLSDSARSHRQRLRRHRPADAGSTSAIPATWPLDHGDEAAARHRLVPAVPQPLDRLAGVRPRRRALRQRRRRRQLQLRRLRPDRVDSERQRGGASTTRSTKAARCAARTCGPAATR